jgi:hypothetical protein
MRKVYLIPLILCLSLAGFSCKKSQEEPKKKVEKKVEKKSQAATREESKESTLGIVDVAENTVGIDLTNSVPVRGVQFTINGVKPTEVRTTSRTKGFMTDYNEKNGKVIMVSLSGNTITPGTGIIAEIICDKGGSASLSEVKIAKK